jgi:NADPH-dependent glutamate synthase beta subunit-like oxidoreductase/ferredoxin
MPTLTIDSRSVTVPEGATVLDAARELGIDIPTLCHLPGKPAQASCFLCMVRIEGVRKLVPSCATAAAEGMVVHSESDEVREARRTAIELLLSDHLGDCLGPCQGVCPAHLETPTMMRQIAAGQFRDALITVKESIALPAALGRVCPELCEKGCKRASLDGPVAVCMLKRYVADVDLASGQPYLPECDPPSGKRVAIIGAGPAGLAAAYYLLQRGHACTLFDEHEAPGGGLRYGASPEVLPRDVLDAEIDVIRQMGADFACGTRVGTDIPFSDLQAEYDAILVAVGEMKSAEPPTPELQRGPQGIRADKKTLRTNLPGVFVAGSAIIGSRHAVRAVADGKAAAQAIHAFLAGEEPGRQDKEWSIHVGKLEAQEVRPFLRQANPEPRLAPSEGVAAGFTEEEALREAQRCLLCDCAAAATCKLRELAIQYDASPNRFRGERREYEVDESHPEVIFEPGKCIACGICVRIAAEVGEELGISFSGRGFHVRARVPFAGQIREGLKIAARQCAEACPTGALVLRSDVDLLPETQ